MDIQTDREIEKFVNSMSRNLSTNKEVFNTLLNDRPSCDNILTKIIKRDFGDENKRYQAVRTLIDNGVDVNLLDDYNCNFIQLAIERGCSEKFIKDCIKFSIPRGLNINNVDNEGNSIVHTAIKSYAYKGKISSLISFLTKYGYDLGIKNIYNNDLYDLMNYVNLDSDVFYNKDELRKVYDLLIEYKEKQFNLSDSATLLHNLYALEDSEVTLFSGKSPLILGNEGCGKTYIINLLRERFRNLEDLDFFSLLCGSEEAEVKLKNELNNAKKNNKILIMEDIDKFVGFSSVSYEILRKYLKDLDLQIIATTSPYKYNNIIKGTELDRSFHKTYLTDAHAIELERLIDYEFASMIDENNYEEIQQVLVNNLDTSNKNDDSLSNISNIGLLQDIINRAYGYASCDERDKISKEDIVKSIRGSDSLKTFVKKKELTIKKLEL